MRTLLNFLLPIAFLAVGVISVVHAADIHLIEPSTFEDFTHTPCAKVVHDGVGTTKTYFVGAKTAAEWQSFYDEVSAYTLPGLQFNGCP